MYSGKGYLEPYINFLNSRKYITLYIKVKLTPEKILVRVTLFQSLT